MQCTGRGVKIAIIDSGVNPAHPHVRGVTGGTRIASNDGTPSVDYLDYIGHGTAVAAAIREKAPEADLYAVKVFDRILTTNIDVIVKAIDWCVDNEMHLVNLSLGTVNSDHRSAVGQSVFRAEEKGTVLIAAREMSGELSLPGCLHSVIGVGVDWEGPRDNYHVQQMPDGPVFIASAYPRGIPGVPQERNMSGISFAVANMTGFVARAREFAPEMSLAELKSLLESEGKKHH
jgi:subtilisin family serine protease